jgi:oxaloacetate decarboxylase beta subunit
MLGFNLPEAASIGIIGGADGPTAIFLSSRLANGDIVNGLQTQNLIGPIAIAAYHVHFSGSIATAGDAVLREYA